MSSILGSITKNDQGGFYPYRTSKVMNDFNIYHNKKKKSNYQDSKYYVA